MWIRSKGEDSLLECRVHPNARKDSIEGVRDDRLHIRLNTPPIEGKANKALIKILSKYVGCSKSKIEIIQGEKARIKLVSIKKMMPEDIIERLNLT